MTPYVLIVTIFFGQSVSSTSADFKSKAACEAAGAVATMRLKVEGSYMTYLCAPKE